MAQVTHVRDLHLTILSEIQMLAHRLKNGIFLWLQIFEITSCEARLAQGMSRQSLV